MKRLLLSVAIAALSTQASAQSESSEGHFVNKTSEIISIGQRIGTSERDKLTVPSSVITAEEIAARGQQYISDLLRSLPGIAVSSSGPASGLTQIRVRGSEANQVLVLIDGVEVSNPNSGEFDFAGLRSEDVLRIETLRGEQSALYGSDAVGGVINIITRAGSTQKGWRGSFEAGARDTIEGQVSTVLPLGDVSLSLNGNLFNTEGFDISGLDGERDGSNSRALNIGLNNVNLGPIALSGKFATSKHEVSFDEDSNFTGRLDNTDGETSVDTITARIDARFDLAGFNHLITGHLVDTDTDTIAGFTSRSIGKRQNVNWAAKRDFGPSNITVLGEIENESYQIIPNFTEADAEPNNTAYAVAGDYGYNAGPLSFTASGRYDINDLFSDAITWRVGAGYALENIGGRLRASVGTGIKNPSLIELFGFFPQSNFTGNADLQPEESLGFSIGYEQKLGNLDVSIDVFRSELENEITTIFNPDFTSSVVNLETGSTRQGVEVEARWNLSEAIFLRGSATYLDSEQDGTEEIRRPNFIASATATWRPVEALSLTANVDYNGNQLDTDFATFSDVTLDAFTLVGARASYALNDIATISIRGENLLNEDYEEVVGFASPGRAIFGGFNLNF